MNLLSVPMRAQLSEEAREKPTESMALKKDTLRSDQHLPQLNWKYIKGGFQDCGLILTGPKRWGKSQWVTFGGVAALTVGAVAVDEEIQGWSQRNRTKGTKTIARWAEPIGDFKYVMGGSGLLFVVGTISKQPRTQRIALKLIEAQTVVAVFGQTTSLLTGRLGPGEGRRSNNWDGPGFDLHASFPSGHSHTAFALATVFAEEYRDKKAVGIVAYSAASLTALSRVHDNHHWTSDVVLGAAMGYFLTQTILRKYREPSHFGINLTVAPIIDRNAAGIGFRSTF